MLLAFCNVRYVPRRHWQKAKTRGLLHRGAGFALALQSASRKRRIAVDVWRTLSEPCGAYDSRPGARLSHARPDAAHRQLVGVPCPTVREPLILNHVRLQLIYRCDASGALAPRGIVRTGQSMIGFVGCAESNAGSYRTVRRFACFVLGRAFRGYGRSPLRSTNALSRSTAGPGHERTLPSQPVRYSRQENVCVGARPGSALGAPSREDYSDSGWTCHG